MTTVSEQRAVISHRAEAKRIARIFLFIHLLITAFLFTVLPVGGQQQARILRIGYLTGTGDSNDPGPFFEAFRQGLRDQGYIEEKNIFVEHRYVDGRADRIPSIVAELVQLRVDAPVLGTTASDPRSQTDTSMILIGAVTTVDPIASGLIDSFARPGSTSPESPFSHVS